MARSSRFILAGFVTTLLLVLPAGTLLTVEDFAAFRAASVDDEDLQYRAAALQESRTARKAR